MGARAWRHHVAPIPVSHQLQGPKEHPVNRPCTISQRTADGASAEAVGSWTGKTSSCIDGRTNCAKITAESYLETVVELSTFGGIVLDGSVVVWREMGV